jgi:hypothetical protein
MSFNNDVLTLGGITFTGFSTPDTMGAGGQQAMVVHKLPGGSRVIDTLGPDEDDIHWSGKFLDDNALTTVVQLDAMRAAGQVVTLNFGGQTRSVVIKHFTYRIRRLPVWIEYDITCTVAVNPSLGILTATPSTAGDLITADLAFAASLL